MPAAAAPLLLLLCFLLISWEQLAAQQTTTSSSSTGCICGKSTATKIVGGSAATLGELPWQAALVLRTNTLPFCGGSLISSKTVLTAAHCNVHSVSSFLVVLGALDLTAPATGQKSFTPTSFVSHPSYNSSNNDNDFAIITLASDVVFSATIAPICLPLAAGTVHEDKSGLISGWGTLTSEGKQPNVLQKAIVMTMSNTACSRSPYLYTTSDILSSMICAASPGKDTCQGDSGGPMASLAVTGLSYELIGVTSFGFGGCANASFPGVYSRVSSAQSWILSKVTGTTCSPPTPVTTTTTVSTTDTSSTSTALFTCPGCKTVISGTYKGTYYFSSNSNSLCPGGCVYLSSTNSSAQFCFTAEGLEPVADCTA